eukprot:10349609-Ditylum_brightwellii.AAC.1
MSKTSKLSANLDVPDKVGSSIVQPHKRGRVQRSSCHCFSNHSWGADKLAHASKQLLYLLQ